MPLGSNALRAPCSLAVGVAFVATIFILSCGLVLFSLLGHFFSVMDLNSLNKSSAKVNKSRAKVAEFTVRIYRGKMSEYIYTCNRDRSTVQATSDVAATSPTSAASASVAAAGDHGSPAKCEGYWDRMNAASATSVDASTGIDVIDELGSVAGTTVHAAALRTTYDRNLRNNLDTNEYLKPQETWGCMPTKPWCGDFFQLPPVSTASASVAAAEDGAAAEIAETLTPSCAHSPESTRSKGV